ncbi:MAG: MBL fold metallo-hydrolase [Clostridia bacterium]|nr:MBL fold metallo-hydrolase [Clostridia bacterium]
MDNTVIILGARGSVPVSGEDFRRFGGATTCVLVKMAGQYIILDCGTGILKLPREAMSCPSLSVIISHAHADHIIGLAMCPYIFRDEASVDIYGASRGELDIKAQLERIFSPPTWPVGTDDLPARMSFHELGKSFYIDKIKVETKEGVHPGGVSLIRLSCEGKSVVFMTDTTLTAKNMPEYAEFAKNCDLLLCDGQYSDEEWLRRRSFGHSTWTAAARLGREANAGAVRIIHHDPSRTDEAFSDAANALLSIHPCSSFAYEEEVILL